MAVHDSLLVPVGRKMGSLIIKPVRIPAYGSKEIGKVSSVDLVTNFERDALLYNIPEEIAKASVIKSPHN